MSMDLPMKRDRDGYSSLANVSTTLPSEARAILQTAAETGSLLQLENAIQRVKQKFPQHFQPNEGVKA